MRRTAVSVALQLGERGVDRRAVLLEDRIGRGRGLADRARPPRCRSRPAGRSPASPRLRLAVKVARSSRICSKSLCGLVEPARDLGQQRVDVAQQLRHLRRDVAERLLELLERRGDGRHLRRVALGGDQPERRAGEEVELHEQQAGDDALHLQLGAQPARDELAELGLGSRRPRPRRRSRCARAAASSARGSAWCRSGRRSAAGCR